MGCKADVIVIGPCKTLHLADCLDYPDDFYAEIDDRAIVLGTLAVADTTEQSDRLAKICNINLWELDGHRVTSVSRIDSNDPIGCVHPDLIAESLGILLADPSVIVWFRPNG